MDPPLQPTEDVVRHLARPAAAQRLLADPRAARMTHHGGAFHYLEPTTKKLVSLRGLTRILKERYWPDYSPWGSRDSKSGDKRARSAATVTGRAAKKQKTRGGATDFATPLSVARGHVRGSMIHEQLRDALTMDRGSFARRHPLGWHPWTRRVLVEVLRRGWFPLVSEYMVTAVGAPKSPDERFRLATSIDLVCAKADGTLVFLELKTSSSGDDFFNASLGAMSSVLARVRGLRNTACHRAEVQLLAGVLMAVRGLGHREDFEAWVVHIDEAQVVFSQLASRFMQDVGSLLWQDLRAHFDAAVV